MDEGKTQEQLIAETEELRQKLQEAQKEKKELSNIIDRVSDVFDAFDSDWKFTYVNNDINKAYLTTTNTIESIQDAFYSLDRQWRFTYINKKFEEIYGKKRQQLLGRTIWHEFPELVQTIVYNQFHRAITEKTPVNFELRSIYLNSWVEATVYPTDEGLSVYYRDITKRKQMEKKIQLNNERLEILVQMSNMNHASVKEISDFALDHMVRLTNSEFGWIGFVNQDEKVVIKYSHSKKVIGKCKSANKTQKHLVAEGGLWAEAIRQRKPVIINDYVNGGDPSKKGLPEGHIPIKRLLNVPIFDGNQIVLQVLVANKPEDYDDSDIKQLQILIKNLWTIIQRKKAEEGLRDSEEKFRNLFENCMDGILITKPDGQIVSVNNATCQMLGMSKEEIYQGDRNSLVDLNDPRLSQLLDTRRKTGSCSGELNFIHKNGSKVLVEGTSNIFQTGKGEEYTSIIIRDISEKVKTQQEMARLDRLNTIGKMAGTLAHEVRQPITALRGFLQMLAGREQFLDHRHYFDFMIGELDRTNTIITNFLTLARNKTTELKPAKLNKIIEEIFPLVQADALSLGIELVLENKETPEIYLDRKEINQLILNLVRNGIEESEQGGQVKVGTFVQGQHVMLFVRDNGKGIDPSIIDKLGTPFLTTKDQGTGLGLATCYSIAENHNAKIDIDSSLEGTTFYVKFPSKVGVTK